MAALKSSELKYGIPVVVKQGDYLFTATRVEFPSGKEYEAGTVELNLEKVGLTVNAVGGTTNAAHEGAAGEAATTTALPAFAWCTNLVEAKTDAEEAKEVKEGYLAQLSVVKTKVFVRIFSVPTAGDAKEIVEGKTATKKTFTAAQAFTVFVLGK